MREIYLGLVGLTFVTGIIAAVYWYRSSRIAVQPGWNIEPADEQLSQAGWTAGTLQAFADSGALNAKAALWTAASVALGSLSAVASIFSGQ
jgi:hypothetical protein